LTSSKYQKHLYSFDCIILNDMKTKILNRQPAKLLFAAIAILVVLVQAGFSQEAGGQETREGSLAAQEAEKSTKLRAPVPDRAEALVSKLEGIFLDNPSGFYPSFGSVYHGGGLTLGAGYRKFYGDNTYWDVHGLYSVENYKLIEGSTESKDYIGKPLSFGSRLGWRDATEVAYYGLGIKSAEQDRANFRFQQTYLDGHVVFRPWRWVPLTGSVAYEHWNTLEGKGDFPSIETRYTPETAPGLGADPTYLHTRVSAGIDWRQSPGYSRKGGLYQATFHDYRNNNGGLYSFQRLDGDVIQHLPLLRETWVLAVRGRVQTTLNDNPQVPYFLMPSLGSGSTLRAFSSDRFRDLHSMLMTGEFRWIPNGWALDMAFFYDAGKVTRRRADLNFKDLKSDVGIGVRLHGPFSTPLRVDLAVGNEGWRLVISSSAPF
jgi:hypothetical protein